MNDPDWSGVLALLVLLALCAPAAFEEIGEKDKEARNDEIQPNRIDGQ